MKDSIASDCCENVFDFLNLEHMFLQKFWRGMKSRKLLSIVTLILIFHITMDIFYTTNSLNSIFRVLYKYLRNNDNDNIVY